MYWYDKGNHALGALMDLGLEENSRRGLGLMRTLAEMTPLFEKLEDWMRFLGYARRDIFAVRLALQEAVTNAIRHGNRGHPGKYVRVTYLVTPAEVLMEVQDQGHGFNADEVPDPLVEANMDRPSGRGVFLMRVYTSWVSYNQQGNRVTLCRQRSNV